MTELIFQTLMRRVQKKKMRTRMVLKVKVDRQGGEIDLMVNIYPFLLEIIL